MACHFVHLRFHSEYSISDGIVRLDPLLHAVKENGGFALGITDLMNIFGGLRFYSHAMADGIKPVIGCDLWITNSDKRDSPYRLTVYCQNHTGYLKLCELLSRGWMDNQYLGRGEVSLSWLTPESCEGLICLTGGPQGLVETSLLEKKPDAARSWLAHLGKIFPGRLYVEVQRAGRPYDEFLVHTLANLAADAGLPLVATHPIQFLKKDEFTAHEVRVCIATGYVLADSNRPKNFTPDQYYKTESEMCELFADLPQALANTVVVAERCSLMDVLQSPQLPDFPTPDGMSLDDYMIALSKEGLEKRLAFLYPDPEERARVRGPYDERLAYELKIIIGMKFPGYFLIVQDFINWSKRNGVPVGPGRGSGAGSLVAYSLGITDLDPLHYKLLFERFLNPERVSMPDFDVDFCQHNRDRTIEYVKRTYGVSAVSQIVTFGAMGAKAVVRDVGRVLNMGYGVVDALAKLIPQKPGMNVTLADAEELEPDFKALAQSEKYAELMTYARALEGITRNLGMHAGGVLIAPGKLTDFCPLYNADGAPENTVSQFDKKDVEQVGLVKFDFLGLTTLTILGKAVEYIDRLNPGTHFELERIPTYDEKTLKIFQEGNTGAVFQFESPGMREQLRQAHPTRLEDLVALNALYRPGPMDQIPHFIDRKFGREKVEYLDDRMATVLDETYGIMVYQEQVMQVAQVIAGYSLGGADLLRRAMGKKNVEEMKKQRAIFIEGAGKRNVSPEVATQIFDLMEKFAGYGFNKSHAAAYSYVAWQTAYLKAHHTAAFIAGNLCLVMDQAEKMKALVDDAKDMGITVRQPDVNSSDWFFTVPDEKTLCFGLGAIKGIAQGIVEALIAERTKNGFYLDIFDVCARVPSMNRKVLEQLVRAGAFDLIDADRGKLFANVQQALSAGQSVNENIGQGSLFGDEDGNERIVNWIAAKPWDQKRRFMEEKAAYGFCLTTNLFDAYRQEVNRLNIPMTALKADVRGMQTMAALVLDVRIIAGAKGKFAVLTMTDGGMQMEAVAYSEAFERFRPLLKVDEVLVVSGRVKPDNRNEGQLTMTISVVKTLEQMRAERHVTLSIEITAGASLPELLKIMAPHEDAALGVVCELHVARELEKGVITLSKKYAPNDVLLQAVRNFDGVVKAGFDLG